MATPPDFSPGQVLTAAHMDAVGLWLVNSTDFTNTSTIEIDGVFTADFTNYRLFVSLGPNSTGTGSVDFQLRAAGSNLSAVNYVFQGVNQNAANAPTANNGATTNGFYLTNFYSAGDLSVSEMTILNPQRTAYTGFLASTTFDWSGPSYYYRTQNGFYTATTVADGFRLVPTAAITGRIRVYGMRD